MNLRRGQAFSSFCLMRIFDSKMR